MTQEEWISSSFRDPSGWLFKVDGDIYRRINHCYQKHYDHLLESGLYKDLVDSGLLIPHEEVAPDLAASEGAYKVVRPQQLDFISYPYEWSFSQLKDAALATLAIQKKALAYGMILKDASAYNIQFVKCRSTLIDTLSFELYEKGRPWVAYRQFCQHFLAPLALMSAKDVRLSQLLRVFIDGIPLDMASALLPFRSKFSFPMLLHIHMHAKSQKRYSSAQVDKGKLSNFSPTSLMGLIDSLESAVLKLKWKPEGTEWVDYYQDDSYSPESLEHKKGLIREFLDKVKPKTLWDLGGNTGVFSRIACDMGSRTISFDVDPACVELNYKQAVQERDEHLLPLWLDLTNPSPAIGWGNQERMTLMERGPVDAVLALALVHHLAISNNVPFPMIAQFLAPLSKCLIIEFVPKSDPKVQRLLSTRKDVFPDYTQQGFEASFSDLFEIRASEQIDGSERRLYLMEGK